MSAPTENRAVSALFRVFGGEGERIVADDQVLADAVAMHRGECRVLSVLVPLTVLVACGEGLVKWLGVVAGLLLAVPASLVLLQFLPFVLCGRNHSQQWRLWLFAGVAWAVFRHSAPGVLGIFAYVWLGIAVMNAAAWGVLAWRDSVLWRLILFLAAHAAAVGLGVNYGWPWGVAVGAVLAGAYCWAVLNPQCQWLGPVVSMANDNVLVTIDDGPDPHDTPILLDLLDRYSTKAVFFMIGEKVQKHPELAREVIRRGHEIGNHTLTHPQASFWCAGPWRTRREIAECQRVIEDACGARPRWFRAPVGHRNFFTHPIAKSLDLQVMAWTRRGYDAVETDAAKVLTRILPRLSAGDIVLLHEATPIAAEVLEGVLRKRLEIRG